MSLNEALGIVETKGLIAAIAATDKDRALVDKLHGFMARPT